MATMTATSTDIRADIRRANDAFESSFAKGDTAALADLYTDNGVVMPPNSEIVTGKEAIKNFWQAVMNMGVKRAKLKTIDIEQQNDTAIERGKAFLMNAEGHLIDEVKYLVIWKRVGDQWKLYQDIWNSCKASQQQ